MKTLTIKEYLFFVYFGLMLWIKGIGLVGGGFYNLILVIGTLIVLVITFMGKTTPAAFAFYLMLLFVAGILPWRIAGDQGPLWCVLFIMAARDMEPKRIASRAFCRAFAYCARRSSGAGQGLSVKGRAPVCAPAPAVAGADAPSGSRWAFASAC